MPTFTIRNTSPAGLFLPYYMTTGAGGVNTSIVGNGAIAGANVLNNCVGYSQGRLAEIYNQINGTTGQNPFTMFNVDAQNWLTVAQNNGFATGMTPQIGAVGVYYASGQNLGHVCNIENIGIGGIWEISESHYYYPNGQGSWDYSYLQPNLLPAFIGNDPDWQLIGFIYPFQGLQPSESFPSIYSILHRRRKKKVRIYLL